jgi:hypothetical protein
MISHRGKDGHFSSCRGEAGPTGIADRCGRSLARRAGRRRYRWPFGSLLGCSDLNRCGLARGAIAPRTPHWPARRTKPEPMTLGQAVVAHVRLIVWCKSCDHRAEPDPLPRWLPSTARGCGHRLGAVVAMYRMRCSGCRFRCDRRAAVNTPSSAVVRCYIWIERPGVSCIIVLDFGSITL